MNRTTARRLVLCALLCIVGVPLPTAGAGASERFPVERLGGRLRPEGFHGPPFTWLHQPAPTASRPALLRRQRKSTVSVGIQGSYGLMRGSSRLGDGFDHGPGYAFRVRYMVSSRAAIGFSFENQNFGPVADYVQENALVSPDTTLTMTTVGAEGILYVHRERETHPYLVAGFGYASPDVVFRDQGSRRTNEGPFFTAGVGLEHFLKPRISLDFTLRGYAEIGNSELTSIGQLNAGIHLYPGD
jgi:outer membrane protein with beta-barrel domain